MYPTYRDRYLPALSLDQINSVEDKESIPVILPTGAIEQHGPHLPVGVDSLMGQAWLDYTVPLLRSDLEFYIAPPVTFGKSNEHAGFPGTIAISKTTLRQQILAIAGQLHAWGFRRLFILNTHGGNIQTVRYTLWEIEDSLEMETGILRPKGEMELSGQESIYGFHAGEAETAWMLEILDGKGIRMELAACEFPARLEDPGELRPEGAPAIYSWITSDLSRTGIMGDATRATREKGERWITSIAESLAGLIESLAAKTED